MTSDLPYESTPAVVLHEERARLGMQAGATRVVVRRRLVSEVRQVEVTVRREVLDVVELSADEGASVGEAPPPPSEIVLSEEVPEVLLRTRPYERVVLDLQSVTEQQPVSATIGREHAEVTTAPVEQADGR